MRWFQCQPVMSVPFFLDLNFEKWYSKLFMEIFEDLVRVEFNYENG